MKVWNLRCGADHDFEGWFASEQAWTEQQSQGLLSCPLCGDNEVRRLPSAPRLNLSGAREPLVAPSAARASDQAPEGQHTPNASTARDTARATRAGTTPAAGSSLSPAVLQQAWQAMAEVLLQNTDDVGTQFAEEARRIHYGEAPERGIRGQASADELAELQDEGIETLTLNLPLATKASSH